MIARLQAAGYPIDAEANETWCYAVQNRPTQRMVCNAISQMLT